MTEHETRKIKRQAYFAAFTRHELQFAYTDTKKAIAEANGKDLDLAQMFGEDLDVIRHEIGHRAKVMRWGRESAKETA